jgi:putative transcriptional regulator
VVWRSSALQIRLADRHTREQRVKNRLRVLRAERNWSQAELAEALGVSRQTINAIEVEKYDPSLPLAFKMARLFGLPIEQIFTDADASAAPPAA